MKIKTTFWQKLILILAAINIFDGYQKILFIEIFHWSDYIDKSIAHKIGHLIWFYFKPFILGLFLLLITIIDIRNKNKKTN